jgi:replicative DNA helicase
MKPEYLAAQRKAVSAVVKDKAFELLLRMHRRHFQDETLGTIIDAVYQCIQIGKPVERETVLDELKSLPMREKLREVAAATLQNIISRDEPYSGSIPEHLAEMYRAHIADGVVEALQAPTITDAQRVAVVSEAAGRIMDAEADGATEVNKILADYFDRLARGEKSATVARAIKLESRDLVGMFGPLVYPAPYVVCGQPGFRKTGILHNLAVDFSSQGKCGLHYTFEDSEETCALKYLAVRHQISFRELLDGSINGERMNHLQVISQEPVPFRVDQRQYGIQDWAMDVRRNCMTRRVDYILLDFIQAFSYRRQYEVAELNMITKTIRQLSKDPGTGKPVPIIYTSQVNKRDEERDGEVTLTAGNAKGSGSIYEDVRFMALLDGWKDRDEKRWKVVKNTWGPYYSGSVLFDGPSGKILGYERGE